MLLRPTLPRSARVTLLGTVLAGTVAAAVLLTRAGPVGWSVTGVGAAVVTALLVWSPVPLPQRSGTLVVGLEPAVLVFLLVTDPTRTATVWWLAGIVVGHLAYPGRRAPRHRVFNVALSALCGATAAGVLTALQVTRPDATGPRLPTLLGILAALLTVLVLDVTLSAVQVTREARTPLGPELRRSLVGGVSALVLVSAGVLAHLGVLLRAGLPDWTLLLLLVPLGALLLVCRQLEARERARWTSTRLHEAALAFGALEHPDQVPGQLERSAAETLDHGRPTLRARPPDRGEVGVPFGSGDDRQWLVHPAVHRPEDAREQDRRALAALALVAEQARDRLVLRAEVTRGAAHDPLTGLLRRGGLVSALQDALVRHPACGGRGLVLLDLDDFKAVNAGLGHGVGDAHLAEVGRRLRAAVGPDDVVARFGGDEFAVLVGAAEPGALDRTGERVLRALRRDHGTDADEIREIGASTGTAGWGPGEDATTVLAHADVALCAAKRAGKGTLRPFDPTMLHESQQRVRMIADLRRDVDSLEVHYQPVIDLHRGRLDGSEALVRWTRDGVDVPPSVFVPLAEECGLIDALGRRVLRQVIADLPAMQVAAGRAVSVAVNLSAHQLGDAELVELVAEGVRVAGTGALLLEMTERVLVNDDAETLAAVHRLTDTGAHLVLDDFGAGYSAIAYLRRLPVEVVKLDRSIVEGVDTDGRRRDLVRGLVALCDAMGITTLAEGVETEGERAVVAELGCDLAQGYFFGWPRPLAGFLGVLRVLREHAEHVEVGHRGAQGAVRTPLPVPHPR